ncbi:mitochondrial glycoprotein [Cryphonectria parasitica EP155]|uniref:Mitochondrial glycoprotein n=1 Tax=Cryphonectria parasitica (strain ATCC 38755 / EP155) TaxID=660469 RepID=A0A9P4XYP7_CRYP1|nr:mitochondrial glycoprotein [Cryphonectria parasitica EP155]KAF3763777.1 mitochondrial glycoprotein [Cryphonectria parasitica EP155]
MFSARSLARSAPRAISRLTTTSRPAIVRQGALLRALPVRSQISAFSTSLLRKAAAGTIDPELSSKLDSEIQFENTMKESETLPVSIKDFMENGPFEIQDTPGQQDVVLTRTYNNEKITVTFSIADIASMDNDMMEEDAGLGEEDSDLLGEGSRSQQEAAEDAEDADGEVLDQEPSVTCRLNIVVEKPGQKGALNIEAVAQDASILVENLYFYQDAAIAHSSSAEAVHKGGDVYPGPPFGTLDEDLQLLMEQYLDERGINSALAVFVPDYMDMKEHREYLAWLKNVKQFVDA